ncbi:hypothetical protein [Asaia sp. HN010]|uniref:hypothetical protein n=1 Tax=Asaia sp. HN010 TaxID=3081233 RepID=UPI0030165FC0
MRKSLKKKHDRKLIRAWTLRLLFGIAIIYFASIGVLSLFRRMGGEPFMNVGFLCAFALMPALLLVIFSIPTRRKRNILPSLALLAPCLGWLV